MSSEGKRWGKSGGTRRKSGFCLGVRRGDDEVEASLSSGRPAGSWRGSSGAGHRRLRDSAPVGGGRRNAVGEVGEVQLADRTPAGPGRTTGLRPVPEQQQCSVLISRDARVRDSVLRLV